MIPTSNVVYFNANYPPSPDGLHVLFLRKLDPTKTYKLQLTSDGATYRDVATISGSPYWSHTVPATGGQLWPRVINA